MAGAIRRRKNIAVSRLKALLSAIDLFDRSNNAFSLGATGGSPWTQVKGTWGISNNKAISGDSPATYPLATLTFTKEDVTISVDGVGPGVGSSFWVTDAGTWWGTTVDGVQQCQTCFNSAVCNQFFTCCNGNTNPVVPGNSFTFCQTTNPGTSFTQCQSGNFNSGWNSGGGGNCATWNPVVPGTPFTTFTCTTWNNFTAVTNYQCGCGGCATCNGASSSLCGGSCCTSSACGGLSGPNGCKRCSNNIAGGNCAAGNTTSGTNPSSGGNCATTNPTNPPTQWTQFTCTVWTTGWNSGNCATWATGTNPSTGGNCNAFAPNCCSAWSPGNSFTCNCVVSNRVRVLKSISGTVSVVATFVFASTIAGFRTILSGNSVTVRAFSGSNYTTQIGSDQSTTVSGYTKTKKHGILKSPVTYADSQTSEINEFRVS